MRDEAGEGIVRGAALIGRYRGLRYQTVLDDTARAKPLVRHSFWSEGEVRSITLGELREQGLRLARAFRALGLGRGDRIAIQMPNRIETAIAYRACFAIGACLTPITHIYGAGEITYILRNSSAKLLIMPDRWRSIDFLDRLANLGDCPDLRHVVIVGDDRRSGTIAWRDLLAPEHDDFAPPTLAARDPILLLYTSGTTAAPKGVLHTSESLLSEVDQQRMRGETGADTTFSAWPAGHIGGYGSLITPQLQGGPAIIMDRWSADDGVRLMAQFGVARTAGVPVLLTELLDTARRLGIELSAMRSYMTGAANVPPDLVERAAAAGIAVFRCYGSTEHPTVTASAPTAPLYDRAHTDGIVLPGGEVRLIDEDGRDVAGIGEGEIMTRGPELCAGYLDAALNAEAFMEDGWFRTGDIGRFDDGRLVITDRKKDIIIRGGENISSKEVEDILARHPAVLEVAAFATPHPRLGEGVCVAVRLRPDTVLTMADIDRHFAAAGVARQKVPERLEIVPDLPRTPSGKVKKYELRRQFG